MATTPIHVFDYAHIIRVKFSVKAKFGILDSHHLCI